MMLIHRCVSPLMAGFALVSVFATSCSDSGSELHPVEGKVLLNNAPLSGALVTFHPKGKDDLTVVSPTALSREDGTFTVTTGQKNGAPAGEYVITIICSQVPPDAKKSLSTGGTETQDVLKGSYAERNNSKIVVTIKKGMNQLEPFDLKQN
jgi:hypothetical protein